MQLRERVLCALSLEEPDSVPLGELVIDNKVVAGFGKSYGDVIDLALGEQISLVGAVARFDTVKNLPDGTHIDEWGATYGSSQDFIAHPIRGPIATEDDLEKHQFPDPEAPHRLGSLTQLVEKAAGRGAINFHARVAFMWSVFLMGMDNLLMTMALNPDFAHRLFARVADINIRIIRRATEAGADTISLGDDYCSNKGPMMSPMMFRKFLLPHLKRAVDAIHEGGARCIKHCDGYLWPILDDMVNAGIDCINPLEPVASMDMAEVKERYGQRLCLMGNIDCGELLCHGTPAEVDQAVAECIRKGGVGGGLIVSSSNSIHSGVKPENYRAMIDAVHAHGQYPIT